MSKELKKNLEFIDSATEYMKDKGLLSQTYYLYSYCCLKRISACTKSALLLLENSFYLESYTICRNLYEHLLLFAAMYTKREAYQHYLDKLNLNYYQDRLKIDEINFCLKNYSNEDSFLKDIEEKVIQRIVDYLNQGTKKYNDFSELAKDAGLWGLYYRYYVMLSTKAHAGNRTINDCVSISKEGMVVLDENERTMDSETILETLNNGLIVACGVAIQLLNLNDKMPFANIANDIRKAEEMYHLKKPEWDAFIKNKLPKKGK